MIRALPREALLLAAEVPVGRGGAVDRASQVEVAQDRGRAQVEVLAHERGDGIRVDLVGAERLDVEAHRGGDADGVRDLQLAAARKPRGDDVLGHPAAGVGGRAVDLGRILARERATAVAGHAAVGVDDDLASRQSGVAHRPADLEHPRRVHEHEVRAAQRRVVEQLGGNRGAHDVLHDRGSQLAHVRPAPVLRGDDDALDADGLGHALRVAAVAHGDLRLAVGQQSGHRVVAADGGQAARDGVREHERQRHQLGRLVAGEAEHHPLVARADAVERIATGLARLQGGVDALCDVGGLLVERNRDGAGVGVEAVLGTRVADLADDAAHDLRHVERRSRGDLPGDQDEAGREQRLARHPTERILAQHRIQNRIRDLVGDLVGVAFGHGLRGEHHVARHRRGSLRS